MRRMLVTLAIATSLAVPSAFAQDTDFAKADAELNTTFKEVEKRLADDADGKARLVAAQKAWIGFRDAECTFQSQGDDGGSAAPQVIATCQATLTTARTAQLKAYLNCQEGDLSCPVPAAP